MAEEQRNIREKNLIPFVKGKSGNPKGKPKGKKNRATVISQLLKVVTNSKNPITGVMEQLTQEERMNLAMLNKAINDGDIQTIKEIQDTMYGKIKDVQDVNQKVIKVMTNEDEDENGENDS